MLYLINLWNAIDNRSLSTVLKKDLLFIRGGSSFADTSKKVFLKNEAYLEIKIFN